MRYLLLGGSIVAMSFAAGIRCNTRKPNASTTIDDYHGVKVADPYRWLEDDVRKSKEVADGSRPRTRSPTPILKAIPEREPIRKRLTELWNYEQYSAPVQGRQPLLLHARTTACKTRASCTSRTRSTASRACCSIPTSGRRTAPSPWAACRSATTASTWPMRVNEAGSDWSTWQRPGRRHRQDCSTDELKWVKFSDADWTPDGKGFFYSRFPEPKKGEKFQGLIFNPKLCYHRVGTPQADDVLVYERPDHPDWGFARDVTEDGRYLVISTWKGTDHRYRIVYKDLEASRTPCRST